MAVKKPQSKKTKTKKSAVKKQTPKATPTKVNNTQALAIIDVNDLIKPELQHGKFSMIPTTLNERQLGFIVAPTDPRYIRERPGKGGGKWQYITGHWFKKRLNFVFGFMWDFDIISERIDGNFVTVKGKLIVKDPKTLKPMIEKTDFGGAEIKFKKNTRDYLDISNDFKAASTDCLKRCCVQLGFAMDVYGAEEMMSNDYQTPPQPIQPAQPAHTQPTPATNTGKVDYCKKLVEYVTKNNEGVAEGEVVSFINYTLKSKYTKKLLSDQQEAQQVLGQLLKNK